jgi:dTMP kinase
MTFLVVEGPNGVGKSTVVPELAKTLRLELPDRVVHATGEPSSSQMGHAIRFMQDELTGNALALACAADRMDHLNREIVPALARGDFVVCDRYVPSSLVLQRLDGLDVEAIWQLNHGVLKPDLTIYLEDEPNTIRERLALRPRPSRFEVGGSPELELALYREARDFLAGHGWQPLVIDCRSRTPAQIAAQIANFAITL